MTMSCALTTHASMYHRSPWANHEQRESLHRAQLLWLSEACDTAALYSLFANLFCRFYNKAFKCIPALRGACVLHRKGQAFNTFLEQMAAKYEHDRLRSDSWRSIMDAKISLINNVELSDMETTKEESEAFLQQHTPSQQVLASLLLCLLVYPYRKGL